MRQSNGKNLQMGSAAAGMHGQRKLHATDLKWILTNFTRSIVTKIKINA